MRLIILLFLMCSLIGCNKTIRPSVNEEVVDQQIKLAEDLIENGRLEQGIKILDKSSKIQTADPQADITLATIHFKLENYELANRYYSQANIKKATFIGLIGEGKTLLHINKPHKAIKYFNNAIKIKRDREALLGMAVALDITGRNEQAKKIYVELLRNDSDDTDVINNYGMSFALSGDFEKATSIFEELTHNNFSENEYRQNLALVYLMAGNKKRAWQVAKKDISRKEFNQNSKLIDVVLSK